MNIHYQLATVSYRGFEFPVMEIDGKLIAINQGYTYFKEKTGKRDLFKSGAAYTMLDILGEWEIFDTSIFPAMSEFYSTRLHENLQFIYDVSEVAFLPPVNLPGKVLNAGSNYYDHAKEMGAAIPNKNGHEPYFFYKGRAHTLIGHKQNICLTPRSNYVDWEAEMALVIGKTAKNVPVDEAQNYIAGYTCYNDISARDRMIRIDETFDFDWFSNKGNDTFGPIGPYIVPAKFISDPGNLKIDLYLNKEHMQDTNTNLMVWNVAELIATASSVTTLDPGDVIATGTGAGVGMSKGSDVTHYEQDKLFEYMYSGRSTLLKPGDKLVVKIAEIGCLENKVVDYRP